MYEDEDIQPAHCPKHGRNGIPMQPETCPDCAQDEAYLDSLEPIGWSGYGFNTRNDESTT